MTAPPALAPRRGWLLPAVVTVVAITVVVAIAGLAWALNRDNLPPAPSTFHAPAPVTPVNVYEVKEANESGLLLASADGSDIRVPRPVAIDTVVPATALAPGDWVNVIGIVDDVRNFSIRAILVLSAHGAAGADGVARTPSGFTGLETRRDPIERIVIGGQVVRVDGQSATLNGPTGEIVLTIKPGAQVFHVQEGKPAEIRAGDRLASKQAAVADQAFPVALVSREGSVIRTEPARTP